MRRLLALVLLVATLSGCSVNAARWSFRVGVAADVASTRVAIHNGARNANPLLGNQNPEAWSLLCALGVEAFAEYLIRQGHPEAARVYLIVAASIRGAATGWNLVQLARTQK